MPKWAPWVLGAVAIVWLVSRTDEGGDAPSTSAPEGGADAEPVQDRTERRRSRRVRVAPSQTNRDERGRRPSSASSPSGGGVVGELNPSQSASTAMTQRIHGGIRIGG